MPVLEQPSDVLPHFCHGDLDAFEALFRRHQSEVYGWIVHIVRDPAAAEDLTVETFWRASIARTHALTLHAASGRGRDVSPPTLRSIT